MGEQSLPLAGGAVKMGRLIAEAVAVLRERGDANLHYVDGLTLFGHAFAHHMLDQLHPDAESYRVLDDRYGQVVMPLLGLAPTEPATTS